MRTRLSIVPLLSFVLGCGNSPPAMPAPSGPSAIFAPPAAGAAPDLATVPWPSDLYLDASGHVVPASLRPLQPRTNVNQLLLDELAQRDGFAVTAGAFFPVSAALDPASVQGRVRLFDLEGAGEIPLTIVYRGDDLLIHARPKNGRVLAEHHRHAYVLTRGVTASGMPLAPSADFLAVRDATARPADPRLARAWDLLQPLNDTLVQAGIGREDVLCAAVFTTESVSADLAAARAALYKEPAPAAAPAYVFAAAPMAGDDGSLDDLMGKPAAAQPGLDNPGGVTHANLAFVVQGSFVAPDFLAATQPVAGPTGATASQLGHITDASGAPMIQGHATIPFTLALPAGLASLANVPLVIVGHGIGGDRTAVLAVADTFAQKGLATLGIDFPFHGLRNPSATDLVHNLGCTNAGCRMGPDGFAESTTTAFLLFTDIMGGKGVPPLDPDAIGSTWRQAALDLMATVRLAADGSFAALATKDPRLAGLSFAGDSLGYTGSSLASIIGTLMLSVEPRVKGAALSVGGGGIVFPLVTWSPEYRGQLEPLLENSIGIPASTDPVESDFGHNLFQFLLERGDPLASAPLVASRPVHLLLAEAFHDETVPNAANEALAQALLLGYAQTTTGGTPQFAFTDPAPATVPKAPQSANRTVQEQPVTALFFQMQEATHPMLEQQQGFHTKDTTKPPFAPLPQPVPVQNPIAPLQTTFASFLSDVTAGQLPTLIDQ